MDESRQGSLSQSKTIKAEEIITSKTKLKKKVNFDIYIFHSIFIFQIKCHNP